MCQGPQLSPWWVGSRDLMCWCNVCLPLSQVTLLSMKQPLLGGFLSTFFLKTLSYVEGPRAPGEWFIVVYQHK